MHNKTTSIRGRIVLYLLWSETHLGVFFWGFFFSFFFLLCVVKTYSLHYVLQPAEPGRGVEGRGLLCENQSSTFQLHD